MIATRKKTMTDENQTTPTPTETTYVKERRIACNGGNGALGHPMVYYSLDDGEAICGYCDRKFVFDPVKAGQASA